MATDVTIASDTSMSVTGWPELHKQRKAIVVVDVVESVRLMQANEADVIDRWRRFVNEVRTQVLPAHGGRLVKSLGDGLLLEFETVHQAVVASHDIQRLIGPFNVACDVALTIELRVGVHVAEVVIDDLDIYGSGVNLAARVASLAEPGGIVVTEEVRDCLIPGVDAEVLDLGECYLKHIDQPVRAFGLSASQRNEPTTATRSKPPGRLLTPTLIVLPFECVADTAVHTLVGDILTTSLIESLSRTGALTVIDRLSSASLIGRRLLPTAVLRELGADFALTGQCTVTHGVAAVSFELTETRHGAVLWVGSVEDKVTALLQPRCELVQHILSEVSASLLQRQTLQGVSQPLPSLQGHAIQAGAISLMHRSSRTGFDRVGSMLEHLIERHNRVATPRAWLAKWYVLRVTRGLVDDPTKDARRALDHTRRAIDADPSCALALAMEGFVYCHLLRDLDQAAARLDRAVLAGPNEAMAWLLRGMVHAFRDEGEQAVTCTERALTLSPIDPLKYYLESLSAAAAVAAGKLDRAIELAQRSIASNALHASTYRTLAIAQSLRGDGAEATETVRRMLAIEPGFSIERFLARVPSGATTITTRFAQALADAGVPRQSGARRG